MATYDPLIDIDYELLKRDFVEGSAQELREQGGLQDRLNYLMQLGYFTAEQTHYSPDSGRVRWRFTRTAKPLAH